MLSRRVGILVVGLSLLVCGPAFAVDRVVNADGTGEYVTIDDAVGWSNHGDRVLLMPGVYTGVGNANISIEADITIMAYDYLPGVVIDCQGSAGNPRRAFNVVDGSPTFMDLTFTGGYAVNGGAIEIENYTTTINRCQFIGNTAERGGAISATDIDGLTLDHCLFSKNHASIEGGGVYVSGAFTTTVTHNTFFRNFANYGAGFFVTGNADLDLNRTIIVLGRGSDAVGDYYAGTITAVECDLWGNASGDWTGTLAAQQSINNNLRSDPRFCDPDAPEPNFQVSAVTPTLILPWLAMGSAGLDVSWAVPVYGVSADGSGMFPTIQAALDTALVPAEIVLKAGEYSGAGNRGLSFGGDDFTLRSRDRDATTTTINAGFNDRVIWLHEGETTDAVISDLRLVQGDADGAASYDGYGGGVLLTGAAVTLRGCIIAGNRGAHSGGISANNEAYSLVVEDCTIAHNFGLDFYFHGNRLDLSNTSFSNDWDRSPSGFWTGDLAGVVNMENCDFTTLTQGIHIENSANTIVILDGTTFTSCANPIVVDNSADVKLFSCSFNLIGGPAIKATDSSIFITTSSFSSCQNLDTRGGAISLTNSIATIRESDFTDNSSNQGGGAFYATNSTSFIIDCTFTNNWCLDTIFDPDGGAIYNLGGTLSLTDSVFDGNHGNDGGAVSCQNALFSSAGCEFTGNQGNFASALSVLSGPTAMITELVSGCARRSPWMRMPPLIT